MVRHAVAAAVAVCLMPVGLLAQGATFTVSTASANVHKGPSTGSAVIGNAARGAVLPVTRELGSWVRISWPDAPDGVGYLHVSWGVVGRGAAADSRRGGGTASAPLTPGPIPPSSSSETAVTAANAPQIQPRPATRQVFVAPATHRVGVGGRMDGSPVGFGATLRAWRPNRLGGQIDVSHHAATGSATPARVTSIQVEPSVLYSLPDRITDYLWLRPYVGSGPMLRHHSVSGGTAGTGREQSGNGFGLQAFGGSEVTFAGAPQFAVSLDLRYQWFKTPIDGFDLGGMGVSVLGHWYVK
jgi:hypothetical protein